jgi:hypothetical protein
MRFVTIAIGIAVAITILVVLGAAYEFSPVSTSWVDYRMNSLGVGRVEATKTTGGYFMTAEGDVYFRDADNHEAESAFRWNYDYPVGGETAETLRNQLANARADLDRSKHLLQAFHAAGFHKVQLRYTSGQDVSLEYPGLLMFDEDPNVNAARRNVAAKIARKLVPPSSQYELIFLPEGRHVSDSDIIDLQDETDLAVSNPGQTVTSN